MFFLTNKDFVLSLCLTSCSWHDFYVDTTILIVIGALHLTGAGPISFKEKHMKKMNSLRLALAAVPALAVMTGMAQAQTAPSGIGDVFSSITTNLGPAIPMIMIAAFLGGLFFVTQAVLKMKDAKENPRDNSTGSIVLNWVAGIFLIFMGGAILMMQGTLGGISGNVGGTPTVTYNAGN